MISKLQEAFDVIETELRDNLRHHATTIGWFSKESAKWLWDNGDHVISVMRQQAEARVCLANVLQLKADLCNYCQRVHDSTPLTDLIYKTEEAQPKQRTGG